MKFDFTEYELTLSCGNLNNILLEVHIEYEMFGFISLFPSLRGHPLILVWNIVAKTIEENTKDITTFSRVFAFN